ncbi:MAG: hypothetical protein ACREB3_03535 [Burkholderiales bacterium]
MSTRTTHAEEIQILPTETVLFLARDASGAALKLLAKEMAARGLDTNGYWVGFKAASQSWELTA